MFCHRTYHQPYVPGVQNDKLLVPASDKAHRGFGLGYRADQVLAPRDVKQGTLDVREVYALAAEFYLPLGELVLLAEVSDPLPESLAREGPPVVHPLTHG